MSIGELNEGPLHASLKEWFRRPGDEVESAVDGFVVDLVRGEELIEIQTGGFSAMRRKFDYLLDRHPMRLVHPVAVDTCIVRVDAQGVTTGRRRSPRHGRPFDVCSELVSFPTLLSHPNFTLVVVMAEVEEVRRGGAPRRRGQRRVLERRLVEVREIHELSTPTDLLSLLPPGLAQPFTTADLAEHLGRHRRVAQDVVYCLRTSDVLTAVARDRAGIRYRICSPA